SAMPLGQWALASPPTSVIGRAARASGTAVGARASVGMLRSTSESQVWHSPQRPTHLTLVQPHSVHTNPAGTGRAMPPSLGGPGDRGDHSRRVAFFGRCRPPGTRRRPQLTTVRITDAVGYLRFATVKSK